MQLHIQDGIQIAFALENVAHLDRTHLPELDDDDSPLAVEMEDMRHPSAEGTKQLLMMMNDFNGEKLIWNEKFIVNDQRYRRIQTIPKYGCKGCQVFNEKPISGASGLCTDCDEQYAIRKGNSLLADITKRINEEAKKRKRPADQSDDEYAKKPFAGDTTKTPTNNRSYAAAV